MKLINIVERIEAWTNDRLYLILGPKNEVLSAYTTISLLLMVFALYVLFTILFSFGVVSFFMLAVVPIVIWGVILAIPTLITLVLLFIAFITSNILIILKDRYENNTHT